MKGNRNVSHDQTDEARVGVLHPPKRQKKIQSSLPSLHSPMQTELPGHNHEVSPILFQEIKAAAFSQTHITIPVLMDSVRKLEQLSMVT
jgi:hypothetical protein